MRARKNAGYWNGKTDMDCVAREGIQFPDSNRVRRLPAAKGSKKPTILVVDDEVASVKYYR